MTEKNNVKRYRVDTEQLAKALWSNYERVVENERREFDNGKQAKRNTGNS